MGGVISPYGVSTTPAGGSGRPVAGNASSSDAKSLLSTMLRLLFEKNASTVSNAAGVIRLNGLRSWPDLVSVQESVDFNRLAFCDTLVTAMKEVFGMPAYLDVSDNGITSFHPLIRALQRAGLASAVKGLSAERNAIASMDFINDLIPCTGLQELNLDGNPLQQEGQGVEDYRLRIRKGLPSLIGLDGSPTASAPLWLPWPQPNTHLYTPAAMEILQFLQDFVLQPLTRPDGPDVVAPVYHPCARFSVAVLPGAELKTPERYPKEKRDIPRDFVMARMAQQDHNRNLMMARNNTNVVQGRCAVGGALRTLLYPESFVVAHEYSPNADVAFVSVNSVPTVVATIHGTMHWRHRDHPLPPGAVVSGDQEGSVSRHFDRSFMLVSSTCSEAASFQPQQPQQDQQQQPPWLIATDTTTLRLVDVPEPLLLPTNASRITRLARSFDVSLDVLQAAVALSKTDRELHLAMTDWMSLSPTVRAECVALSSNGVEALSVGRAVARLRMSAACAAEALRAVGFDLARLESTVASAHDAARPADE